jgi:hypothetical protein
LDVIKVPITTFVEKLALSVLERVPEMVRLLRAATGLQKVAWLDVVSLPRMVTLELKLALFVLERVPMRERLERAVMGLQKVA